MTDRHLYRLLWIIAAWLVVMIIAQVITLANIDSVRHEEPVALCPQFDSVRVFRNGRVIRTITAPPECLALGFTSTTEPTK